MTELVEKGPTELTDVGNGERFTEQHGDRVRYSFDWNKWFWYDGRRWVPDANGEVYRLGKQTAQRIYAEASQFTEKDQAKRVANWAHQSQSKFRIAAMLDMAKSEKPIPLDYRTLDLDGWLLNCENGTVDLKTGKLRDHDAGDFLSLTTGVSYPARKAIPTLWLRFLSEIFEDNEALIGFVQRLCGVALVGHIYEHILPMAIGVGCNGKSVLCETVRSVFGHYAMAAPQGLLMVKRFQTHSTETADLFRKRLVIVSETNDDSRLNEGLVKSLTGGEAIRARRMREDNWEFDPTHTLLLVTNHRPIVRGRDVGIWRRLRLIPFNAQIAAEKQDAKLAEKLRAEYPAILAWMVQGCLDWQQGGLQEPQEVLLATDEYKAEQDVLGSFVDECCMLSNSFRVKASTLYQGYRKWAETSGEKIETQRSFGTKMTERGFERIRNNGIWYMGLTLNEG